MAAILLGDFHSLLATIPKEGNHQTKAGVRSEAAFLQCHKPGQNSAWTFLMLFPELLLPQPSPGQGEAVLALWSSPELAWTGSQVASVLCPCCHVPGRGSGSLAAAELCCLSVNKPHWHWLCLICCCSQAGTGHQLMPSCCHWAGIVCQGPPAHSGLV